MSQASLPPRAAIAAIGLAVIAALTAPQSVFAQGEDWLARTIGNHWSQAGVRMKAARPDAWTVNVSPNGAGGGDSVQTLDEAQARVRAILADIRSGKKPARPIDVHLAAGTYMLTKPLHLTADDGGNEKSPVTYVGDVPGKVFISGGVSMHASTGSDGRLKYDLPAGLNVDWSVPHQLFVGGQPVILARQPNAGNFYIVQPGSTEKGTVMPDPKALQWLRGLSNDDSARADLFLYHSWDSSLHRFSVNGKAVNLNTPAKWTPLQFGKDQRYFIENVAAALDAPGEWLGAGRQITYIPRPGEAALHPDAVLPVTQKLIEIAGTSKGQAGYISFLGLTFEYTELNPNTADFVEAQAGVAVGAVIEVDHARHIEIRECQISHVGGFGIWYRGDVADSKIENTVIEDTAGGGVKIGATGRAVSADTETRNNTLTNSVIARTGRVFPGSVGVWIGWASDNRVEKNVIAETTYSGVSVGWNWGFGGPASQGNHINSNLLFDIGRGDLSDMAGIYTLGESPGTEIAGNLIREVRSHANYGPPSGLGGWGIYLDAGSSGIHVFNNVVVGTDSGGFHITYGRDNVVEKNVFANGEQSEVSVFHDQGGKTFDFRGNLLFPNGSTAFEGVMNATNSAFGNNVVGAGAGPHGSVGVCGNGCSINGARVTAGRGPKDIQVSGSAEAEAIVQRVRADAGPAGGMDSSNLATITERRPRLPQPGNMAH